MYIMDKCIEEAIKADSNLTYQADLHSYVENKKQEMIFIYDKVFDFIFSYSITFNTSTIHITFAKEDLFYEQPSIRLRASQIFYLFFPTLEDYFLHHPSFRVKLALRDVTIITSPLFFKKEKKLSTNFFNMMREVIRKEVLLGIELILSSVLLFSGLRVGYFLSLNWYGMSSVVGIICCLGFLYIPYMFVKEMFSLVKKTIHEKNRIQKIQRDENV